MVAHAVPPQRHRDRRRHRRSRVPSPSQPDAYAPRAVGRLPAGTAAFFTGAVGVIRPLTRVEETPMRGNSRSRRDPLEDDQLAGARGEAHPGGRVVGGADAVRHLIIREEVGTWREAVSGISERTVASKLQQPARDE